MILPVLELQPGVPVGAKQAVSATADAKSSFSAAFDESLRVSAQSQLAQPPKAQTQEASGLVLRAQVAKPHLAGSGEAEGPGTKDNLSGWRAPTRAGSTTTQGVAKSEDSAGAPGKRAVSERSVVDDVGPAGLNASLVSVRSNVVRTQAAEAKELAEGEAGESASTIVANVLEAKAVPLKSALAGASATATGERVAPRAVEDVLEAGPGDGVSVAGRARSEDLTAVLPDTAAHAGAAAAVTGTSKLAAEAGKGITVKTAVPKDLSAREGLSAVTVSNGTLLASSTTVSVGPSVDAQQALPKLAENQQSGTQTVAQTVAQTGTQSGIQTTPQTAPQGVTETTDGRRVIALGVRGTAISETNAQGATASTTLSSASPLIGKAGPSTPVENATTAFSKAAVEPHANRQSGEAVKAHAITELVTPDQTIYHAGRTLEATSPPGSLAKQNDLAGSPIAAKYGIRNAAVVASQDTTSTARAGSDDVSAIKAAQANPGSDETHKADAASSGAQQKSSGELAAAKSTGAANGNETLVSPGSVFPGAGAHLLTGDGAASLARAVPNVPSRALGQLAGASVPSATKPSLHTAAATSIQGRAVTGGNAVAANSDGSVSAVGSALRPPDEPTVDIRPSHPGQDVAGRNEASERAIPSAHVATDAAHDSARSVAGVGVSDPGPAPSVATANHAVNVVPSAAAPLGPSSAAEISAGAGSAAATVHPAAPHAGVSAGAGLVGAAGSRELPISASSSSVHGGGVAQVAGAAGSLIEGVEGVEGRTNAAAISEPHRTLLATPTTLEVGVPDGTQGWLRIRAQVGDQGQVSAALTAPSGASQDMLHRELPALNLFLHSEQMAVTATVSERSFAGAGPAPTGADDGSRRSSTEGGMTQGNTAGGGQTDGRQGDAGPQEAATRVDSTLAIDAGRGYSSSAGLSEAASVNSAAGGEIGQWLNVRA